MNQHIETLKRMRGVELAMKNIYGDKLIAQEKLAALTAAIADMEMLEWILARVNSNGSDFLAEGFPWTVVEEDGEDSELRLDRECISAAMKGGK